MYKMVIVIFLWAVMLSAQNTSLEYNLKQGRYREAFSKCMLDKEKAMTARNNFWWRYYYLKIALKWNDARQFRKAKITFPKFQKVMKEFSQLNIPSLKSKKEEIINLYKRYFYPLKVILRSTKNPEFASLYQNPVGKLGIKLVDLEENRRYLSPLQYQRLLELSREERLLMKNIKPVEFKLFKNKYFSYDMPDVPLLQAENQNMGYVIQYAYIDKAGLLKKRSTGKKKASFSLGTQETRRIVILSEAVNTEAKLDIKPPTNIVYIYYPSHIGNIDVKHAEIVSRGDDVKHNNKYIKLRVEPKKKILLKINKQKSNQKSSNVWPIAMGIIGVISFVLAR